MEEYLSELRNKFGYNDDLLKAIEITINLMIAEYGDDQKSEIYSLFAGAEILTFQEVNDVVLNEINEKMHSYNRHIIFSESENPYGCNSVSSSYSYEPIFSGDMKVVDEARFILVQDMAGRFNESEYRTLFGTSINIPYFIHEANHAYAMMHPEYKYEGKKIIAKHGMYITTYEYAMGPNQKYIMKTIDTRDIALEEMINEKITQDMLVKLLNKNNYKEVKDILRSIRHVNSKCRDTMITLGTLFECEIGEANLMDYRRNNNMAPIINFNEKARKSDIALEYLDDTSPYEYFSKKIQELFMLNIKSYGDDIKAYAVDASKISIEAFAMIEAYKEIEHNTTNLERFNKRRDYILGIHKSYQSDSLAN